MLYGSRYSKKKVFHYGDCRYSRRTLRKNQILFPTVAEATTSGYSQCPFCSRIPLEYKKHEEAINSFCTKNGMKAFLLNDEMYVISWDDTAWRIRMKGDGSKEKQLMHESKLHVNYDRENTWYENRKYHVQEVPGTSLTGYLGYIRNHDRCEAARAEHAAEQNRKAKLENALLQEQVFSIKAVQRQISKQNRKKRKHGLGESNSQKRRRSNQQLRDITRSFSDYRAAKAAYI